MEKDLGREEIKEHKIKLAVYAVNYTAVPEGLCPTLMVLGAFPRTARHTPSPEQEMRSETIKMAIEDAESEQASRVLAFWSATSWRTKGKRDVRTST